MCGWVLRALTDSLGCPSGNLEGVTGQWYVELLAKLLPHLPAPKEPDWDDDSDEEDDEQMSVTEVP
jgi:hypothetical protein